MKSSLLRVAAAILVGAGLLCAAAEAAEPAENKPCNTDWLHQAKWGVMSHFCSSWKDLNDLAGHDIKLMLYCSTGMGVPPVPDTGRPVLKARTC